MESLAKALKSGKVKIGLGFMYPCSGAIERIGSDWDWIWIDGQHGQHDYASLLGCVRASDLVQRPSIVRVPDHDYASIGRALDMACAGVMVPMVNTAQQARDIVIAAKFPPLGSRSYGGRRPIDIFGREYSNTANEDSLLIIQIESTEGIENVEEIAAVPGVDVLFIGMDDLSLHENLLMGAPRPADVFAKDLQIVADAAKKHNKIAGGVFPSAEGAKDAIDMGYRMLVANMEVSILANGSKELSAKIKGGLGL